MTDFAALWRDMELAEQGIGDYRAMRVTLECAHLRLMTAIGTIMGIGAQTSCHICPKDGEYAPSRVVVNVEETGVLHDEYTRRVTAGLSVTRPAPATGPSCPPAFPSDSE